MNFVRVGSKKESKCMLLFVH